MIIKGRGGEDIEIQAAAGEWGLESQIPYQWTARLSQAGIPISDKTAFGIPAFTAIVRAASDMVASMPFMTYRSDKSGISEQARSSWQWKLLHDKPGYELDPFQFFYDVSLSLEATQNSFIYKEKQQMARNTRVIGLQVIDPQRVTVRRADDGSKLFDVITGPGTVTKNLTTDEILHVRGFTRCPGDVAGTSLLEVNSDTIGNAIAMQKFEGDYFRNNATPPFFFTGATNKQHAQDILDLHNMEHKGIGNQHKVGALWGQMDVKPIPMSLRDAMFIDERNLSIEDLCRIMRWPRMLMEVGEVREAAVEYNIAVSYVMKVYVLPRLRRIEQAFNADEDLYYGTNLYGEFLTAALERADTHTRYDSYRLARQGGWVTANELRAYENLPPIDGGDELQETPVGGAPNNQSTSDKSPNLPPPPTPDGEKALISSDMSDRLEAIEQQLQLPLVINVPPANVHVAPPSVVFAEGSIQVEAAEAPEVHFTEGSFLIEAAPVPDVNVTVEPPPPADNRVQFAPGSIMVEAAPVPNVTVEQPDVHVTVEAPPAADNRVQFAPGAIQVEAAPTPDVNVTVEAPPPAETKVEFAEGAISVEAPPPAEVNVTVESPAPTPAPDIKFHKGAFQIEAAPTPDVNVTVEAPEAPEIKVEQPEINIDVNLPEPKEPKKPRKAKAKKQPDGSVEIVFDEDGDAPRKAKATKNPDGSIEIDYGIGDA